MDWCFWYILIYDTMPARTKIILLFTNIFPFDEYTVFFFFKKKQLNLVSQILFILKSTLTYSMVIFFLLDNLKKWLSSAFFILCKRFR